MKWVAPDIASQNVIALNWDSVSFKLRSAKDRGRTQLGWLDSQHGFSFGQYWDPEHESFSVLRVFNDDRVAPGMGFGQHSHSNMEIISYVLDGALRHEDSTGNIGLLPAGGVQRMSAGTGIRHAEFNASDEQPVHFLQIWLLPERLGIAPEYEQLETNSEQRSGRWLNVVASHGHGKTMSINQDASMWLSGLSVGQSATHSIEDGRVVYLFLATGSVAVDNMLLGPGDALEVTGESILTVEGRADAELVLFDLPDIV